MRSAGLRVTFAVAALVVVVALAGCTSSSSSSAVAGSAETTPATTVRSKAPDAGRVANPTVLPASGGQGRAAPGLRYDVSDFGYQEHEYYFEGTAKTFAPATLPPAPYRSRMVVWTPQDASKFNGTTVVEWAEVSDFGQFELIAELNYQSSMLEAEGYAFALVSAEEGGVCDLRDTGCTATSLKGADPERYGTLNHPGDLYSYDIFNQALQAIKHPRGVAPLGDLDTTFVIAEGFQPTIDKWFPTGVPEPNGFKTVFGVYGPMNQYLAVGADEDAQVADAFFLDGGAPKVEPARYRVPTLHHLDEAAIRRTPTADSENHVTWEVVGAAHSDRWISKHFAVPSPPPAAPKLDRNAELALRDEFNNYGLLDDPTGATCAPGPRTGSWFPRQYTVDAGIAALREWLETGTPAPAAPRMERVGPAPETPTAKLTRDTDGNTLGGLRSPIIDVPVAAYNGEACVQAGTTIRFPAERLASLYPTHRTYVDRLLDATNQAVEDRFMICQDAVTLMRKASESTIGGTDPYASTPACSNGPPT